uniref:Heme oxygenase 2b n=1 Tax=Hucho hucho TaxID=62062 RepID=A0A4W5KQV5_9TELE
MEDSVKTESAADGGGLVNAEKEPEDTLSPTDLSELLAAGTKEVHEKAENTQFVKDFLRGRIRKELFKLGDVALYYTYEAMEEEIERNKDHPDFSPLYFPELNRRDALSRDLDYFYGEDWRERVSCSPATQRYVERIHQVFDELEEMGKDIQEEVMDAGMPVHGAHGTGGDINKCPYYAAQMGRLIHNSCRLCRETKLFDPENQLTVFFVLYLSGQWGLGVRRSAGHGRPQTPHRPGPIRRLGRRPRRIGCVVLHVIRPTANHWLSCRKEGGNTGREDRKNCFLNVWMRIHTYPDLETFSPLIFSLYYLHLPPSCILPVWLVIFVALSISLEPFFLFNLVIGFISS